MELKKYLLKKVAKCWPPPSRLGTLAKELRQRPVGERVTDILRSEQGGLAQTKIMRNMGKPPGTITRRTKIGMI